MVTKIFPTEDFPGVRLYDRFYKTVSTCSGVKEEYNSTIVMYNFIEKFVNAVGTPCQLHCRPKKKYFSLMLKDVVTDGTPCRPGTRDMCIHGICTVSCIIFRDATKNFYGQLTVKKLKKLKKYVHFGTSLL